ncbi:MAG TPA: GDSL-type esterase/lipase family protein [Verrucomicrobiae bacterium]|nr:GDSL-type esterase/lipase family protein [Verrucomicrobiae bacterium]
MTQPTPSSPQPAPVSFSRKLRRFAIKLSILLITTCICLVIAEYLVRWMLPQFSPGAQMAFSVSPDGVVLGPPNRTTIHLTPKRDFRVTVRFNQYGFRDTKDFRDATPADWFAVGDSFTLGFGVEEENRYSTVLENKLQAAGIHSRVYNIGIPGNFIDYQHLVKFAESNGAKINHLIVGVCMDNDLEDYSTGKSDWELDHDRQPNAPLRARARRWLRQNCALYLTASFVLESNPAMQRFMEKLGIARDLVALDAAYKNHYDQKILDTSLAELQKLAAGHDTVVLLIPSRRLWVADTEVETKIHDTFAKMCRDAGLTVVDLKPLFDKDPNPLTFYFVHDPHWTPRAHEAAAQQLFNLIQARQHN